MVCVADQSERLEDMVGFLKEILKESYEDIIINDSSFLRVEFINFI